MANISSWQKCHERLKPEAWPAIRDEVRYESADSIFTMGSCFARNIEEHLARLGYNIPTLGLRVPKNENFGRGNGILNRYTPASMSQAMEWAARIHDRDGVVTHGDIEGMWYETSEGFIDLQLASLTPVSRERLLERRQQVFDIDRKAFACDLVVVTLGMVEAWKDRETGLYIQYSPHNVRMRRDIGRFDFEVLSHEKCLELVERMLSLISERNPGVRFLMTTSPVPLGHTFTRDDVIVANMHSKSKLRSVCGELAQAGKIDYFPSYESVLLTKDWSVWEPDLLHVADHFVGKIVSRLSETCFPVHGKARRLYQETYTGVPLEGALALIRRAIEIDPAPEYHARMGELLMGLGRYDDAAASCRRALAIDPTSWEAWRQIAVAEEAMGHLESAREALERAMALCTAPSFELHLFASRLLRRLGLEDAAAEEMRKAFRANPHLAMDRLESIRQAEAMGRRDEALALAREAMLCQDDNPSLCLCLGNLLEQTGDLEGARAALERAVALDPSLPGLRLRLSRVLERLGDAGQALRQAREALALDEGNPHLHHHLGALLEQAGDLEGARAALERVIALDPSLPGPHMQLSRVLHQLGDDRRAIRKARDALAVDDGQPYVHHFLGNLLAGSGDFEGAKDAQDKALALDPSIPGAHMQLAHIHFKLGNAELALRKARDAVALSGDNPHFHLILAGLLENGDHHEEAERAREKAREISGSGQ